MSNPANPHWGSTLDEFLRGGNSRGGYDRRDREGDHLAARRGDEEEKHNKETPGRADAHQPRQIDRILDPDKGNVTLETLQRAASLLGRQLRLELV